MVDEVKVKPKEREASWGLADVLAFIVLAGLIYGSMSVQEPHGYNMRCGNHLQSFYAAVMKYADVYGGYPSETGSRLFLKLGEVKNRTLDVGVPRNADGTEDVYQCPVLGAGKWCAYRGPRKPWNEQINDPNIRYMACDREGNHGSGGYNALDKKAAIIRLEHNSAEWQKALEDTAE